MVRLKFTSFLNQEIFDAGFWASSLKLSGAIVDINGWGFDEAWEKIK